MAPWVWALMKPNEFLSQNLTDTEQNMAVLHRAALLCTDVQEVWKASSRSSVSLEPNKSCYLFQGGLLRGAAADQRTMISVAITVSSVTSLGVGRKGLLLSAWAGEVGGGLIHQRSIILTSQYFFM